MQQKLRFADVVQDRPQPQGLDLLVTLRHFAVVTYAVDCGRLRDLIPSRFLLDTVTIGGEERALVSVVPFLGGNCTSAVRPFPSLKVGQLDYRTYVIDAQTGERCVWLVGTTLDSWLRAIPRLLWRLPCYRGSAQCDCKHDNMSGRYERYKMHSDSRWAPAQVDLYQTGEEILQLPGFPDAETGLVVLTHPMSGFYHLRSGALGRFYVWHGPLAMKPAHLRRAAFVLLHRLGIVDYSEQQHPHSVLVLPSAAFTVYLPPETVRT